MKENLVFFVKLCVFVLIFVLFVSCVVMPQYSTEYTAALRDKYERLASLESPKIILVGDSNVAFGFDSQMIEEAFQMPVVNFGLHGGLGMAFHSDMIKTHISKGDIIITIPGNYQKTMKLGNPLMAWITVEKNIYMLKNMPYSEKIEMIKAFPTYLRRSILRLANNEGNLHQDENSAYRRSAFNEYGDNVHVRPECTMEEGSYGSHFSSKYLAEYNREYWIAYADFVEQKDAHIYMSCPPILENALYDNSESILEDLQMQLDTELNFPMISRLTDYIYPLEYFYDTGFHMNDTGRIIRTEQLIRDLKPYLE